MKRDAFGAREHVRHRARARGPLSPGRAREAAGLAPASTRLPFSIKVLLEAVLRNVDGELVHRGRRARPRPPGTRAAPQDVELPFMPARVILQDFTGVPAVVDLAAMRGGGEAPGRRPAADQPAGAGRPGDRPLGAGRRVRLARTRCSSNAEIEFERNRERYEFLRWGQKAFDNFRVVPPATGIVHQVNLEYLAKGVLPTSEDGEHGGLPRHAGRHRLAHHDDQRPGRARLGRRRHRGRGGDARPAALHGHARRWWASSSPASCARASPPPTWC